MSDLYVVPWKDQRGWDFHARRRSCSLTANGPSHRMRLWSITGQKVADTGGSAKDYPDGGYGAEDTVHD
jgi:hypothetical protein